MYHVPSLTGILLTLLSRKCLSNTFCLSSSMKFGLGCLFDHVVCMWQQWASLVERLVLTRNFNVALERTPSFMLQCTVWCSQSPCAPWFLVSLVILVKSRHRPNLLRDKHWLLMRKMLVWGWTVIPEDLKGVGGQLQELNINNLQRTGGEMIWTSRKLMGFVFHSALCSVLNVVESSVPPKAFNNRESLFSSDTIWNLHFVCTSMNTFVSLSALLFPLFMIINNCFSVCFCFQLIRMNLIIRIGVRMSRK